MTQAEVAQLIMGLFNRKRAWDYVEMESELHVGFDLIVAVCRELEVCGRLQVAVDSSYKEGYDPDAFTCHGSLSKVDCSQRIC